MGRPFFYQYFFDKLWMLLKPLFLNLFVVVSAVIVFFRPDSSIFFPLLVNFLFRSLYFISILLFIWRLFPAKDLLQSAFLTIFGLEILGYMVSSFLFPDGEIFLIVFSPILSSLILFGVISDPNAADVLYIVTMFSLALSCIFLLASVVLIKSEIRYE